MKNSIKIGFGVTIGVALAKLALALVGGVFNAAVADKEEPKPEEEKSEE